MKTFSLAKLAVLMFISLIVTALIYSPNSGPWLFPEEFSILGGYLIILGIFLILKMFLSLDYKRKILVFLTIGSFFLSFLGYSSYPFQTEFLGKLWSVIFSCFFFITGFILIIFLFERRKKMEIKK